MLTSAEITSVAVYQFHVLLLEISPAIWRWLLVRSDATIADLHYALQIVMGWDDSHLHRFVLHGNEFGVSQPGGICFTTDPLQLTIADWRLRPKERFLYEYDFHANWCHQVRLEQILPLDPSRNYPWCLAGARQVPPEYCSGPWDFMAQCEQRPSWRLGLRLLEILDLLRAQQGDLDDYRAELRQLNYWLNVDRFDRKAANHRLQQYAASAGEWAWSD